MLFDELDEDLYAIGFDSEGNYVNDFGYPDLSNLEEIVDRENLFGIDLNNDGVQGRNLNAFDRDGFYEKNGISFLGDGNRDPGNTELFIDPLTGELFFSDASDSSNQQSLYNRNGLSFIPQEGQTAVDIEQDSDGNLQLLSYREAGSITTYITEMVKKKGKKNKNVTVPEIREQIEYFDAGFVLTTFDQYGYLIQESIPLEPGDTLTYNAESLFGIDINGDGEEGLNISSVDELQELQSYGFTTFDEDYTNQTDLYIDANTGDLYFASVDTPDNKLELVDFDGSNFGINTQDGFTPIAVETVDIPSLSQYSGTHVLLAYDEYYDEFVGFLFDEFGNYLEDLGAPYNPQATNDAENLFGFDLNDDGVQGRNVQIVDTASSLAVSYTHLTLPTKRIV